MHQGWRKLVIGIVGWVLSKVRSAVRKIERAGVDVRSIQEQLDAVYISKVQLSGEGIRSDRFYDNILSLIVSLMGIMRETEKILPADIKLEFEELDRWSPLDDGNDRRHKPVKPNSAGNKD
jgi:hypothetical protein